MIYDDGTTTFDMGGFSAAELQRATCATLGFLFAQVLTVDEMIRKLSLLNPSAATLPSDSKSAAVRQPLAVALGEYEI